MRNSSNPDFSKFFQTATGNVPYSWQTRLAEDPDCKSRLIDIPTGLGKTAGVVIAWLWNRQQEPQASDLKSNLRGKAVTWPRRLVYCLPMRTLVEQTAGEVKRWLGNLDDQKLLGTKRPRVVILMGGEDPGDKDWDLYPEDPAILIGTQDMLLSRALNRGYGMSRYRWPMHFALLNNDALWVMDEVQLMGVGLETSAQLQGLRATFSCIQPCSTWWMSATVAPERLKTPDFKSEQQNPSLLTLDSTDRSEPHALGRINAKKTIRFSDLRLSDTKTADLSDYAASVTAQVTQTHESGSLTVVILNRVDRAQEVFKHLKTSFPDIPRALIHSRFRYQDRAEHMKLLDDQAGGILVATQAVEAGLDISARHLFSELAPWSSLVQRMGRCNRDGEQPQGGTFHWIDLHSTDAKKQRELALPYNTDDLTQARSMLAKITDASPDRLRAHSIAEAPVIRPILRKKDMLDLFDTTPDLAGLDLDVSRYIRDGSDTDVEVFWREIPKDESPSPETHQPVSTEICRVSIGAFRTFVKKTKSKRIWRWQGLSGAWEEVSDQTVYSGMTYLIAVDVGGYSSDFGWTGDPKGSVCEINIDRKPDAPEPYADDPSTRRLETETLESHTAKVTILTEKLAALLLSSRNLQETLTTSARWHDLGKTHYHFQKMLLGENKEPDSGTSYLAKSKTDNRCKRRFFRHELASALGWLALVKDQETTEQDLVAYLIAAHHGKVRLSIRPMPNEQGPKNEPDRPFARGIWHNEQLPYEGWPAIHLNGKDLHTLTLDLAPLTIGGGGPDNPSWLERTLKLRDRSDLGPFTLSYMETLLRAADGRASASTQGI